MAWSAAAARAHPPGVTVATLIVEPRVTQLELSVKAADLGAALGVPLVDARGRADPRRLREQRDAVAGYLDQRVQLFGRDGRRCPAAFERVEAADDGVVLSAIFACGSEDGPLAYASSMIVEVAPATVQHLLVLLGEDALPWTVEAGAPPIMLVAERASLFAVSARYLGAGITHILEGYDHLAFLIALLLWAQRAWPVLALVTAFTLAHSITLSLAALGLFELPARLVEVAIAGTVVWVALENFLSQRIETRWRVALLLGLVHGFGFAGALRSMGLPTDNLLAALAAFNFGVELGQLGVVVLLVPLLRLVDRLFAGDVRPAPRSPLLVHGLSGAIGLAGLFWLTERLLAGTG